MNLLKSLQQYVKARFDALFSFSSLPACGAGHEVAKAHAQRKASQHKNANASLLKRMASFFSNRPSIIVLLAFASACNSGNDAQQADEHAHDEHADEANITLTAEQTFLAQVVWGKAEQRALGDRISCTGRIEAPPQSLVSVHATVAGYVRKIDLLPGDAVRKGQAIARLENPEWVKIQQEWLEIGATLPFLEKEMKRSGNLAQEQAGSVQAQEQALMAWEVANIKYQSLKAQLQLMGFNTDSLTLRKQPFTQLAIYSPVNGFVSKVGANLGKLVHPDEWIYELIDDRHLHLDLQVYAEDAMRVRKGQSIEFWLPGSTDAYHADVYLVGKTLDEQSRTVSVHGHFHAKDGERAIAGTLVKAQIAIDPSKVWALPKTAIVQHEGQQWIFAKTTQGAERIPVQLGKQDGDWVEIIGFSETRDIALQGAYYLVPSGGGEHEH